MANEKKQLIKQGSRLDTYLSARFDSHLFSYREIFSMLLPIFLDSLFLGMIGVLSTALISSSSQESVSATSLMGPVQITLVTLVNAFAAGGTVIVAQYKGKMDEDKTRISGGQVIFGTFAIATAACIFLAVFATPIINLLFSSVEEAVKLKGHDYLVGMGISMVPYSLYISCFSVFRGIGKTKTCLRLTIIINTIYLAANVLFINVLKLDILGTALAMNVARVIGGAIAMYALMGIHSPLRVTFSDIFRVQRNVLMSILRVAVPYGVEQVFFTGGNLIVQIYMAVLGTANVASYAIANSSVGLMYAVTTSVGTLAITVCGRSTGANDKVLTRRYGKSMMSLSFVLTFISVLVFTPLMPLTLKLYGAPAENLALIYRLVMIITIPLPFFYPTASVMPNILRSAGDSAYSSMISLITMWVIRVALGYYLGIVQGMGVAGVVCCFGIEWAVKSVFYALRFRGESWLNKKTIEE